MGQTLTNGIYLPDEGERNSYDGLEANWRTLDSLILTVNGKAAPNVANTWTAAQTFTAGIAGDLTGNVTGNVTGNLTGTASKAIADEDGTSIKSGYVNVAGNQTVSGQKTWSGNQFFTSPMYPKNTSYEIGNTPASNVAIPIYFTDKNNVYTGYVRSTIYTSGRSATEIRAKNAFKNGALDPTGSDISSNLNVEVQPSGAKTIYWDGLIRNDVTPYTTNNNSLGSSTNQWSSVYAQSYYYNGTAWGLDKANVWTGVNTFAGSTNTVLGLQFGSSGGYNDIRLYDSGGSIYSAIRFKPSNVEFGLKYSGTSAWYTGAEIVLTDSGEVRIIAYDGTEEWTTNFTSTGIYPASTNALDLGTSTNKWKTLNGINPGALSLPDYNSTDPIDFRQWSTTGAMITYTPTVSGWLQITASGGSGCYITILDSGTNPRAGQRITGDGIDRLFLTYPVIANRTYWIYIVSSAIETARIVPCLGNV